MGSTTIGNQIQDDIHLKVMSDGAGAWTITIKSRNYKPGWFRLRIVVPVGGVTYFSKKYSCNLQSTPFYYQVAQVAISTIVQDIKISRDPSEEITFVGTGYAADTQYDFFMERINSWTE